MTLEGLCKPIAFGRASGTSSAHPFGAVRAFKLRAVHVVTSLGHPDFAQALQPYPASSGARFATA